MLKPAESTAQVCTQLHIQSNTWTLRATRQPVEVEDTLRTQAASGAYTEHTGSAEGFFFFKRPFCIFIGSYSTQQ